MEKNLGQKVLGIIQERKITPKPRWTFIAVNLMIWSLGVACLIAGGIATAAIIHMLKINDWDLYSYVSDHLWMFILMTLPYFWIAMLCLFMVGVYGGLRKTKYGYRYNLPLLITGSILTSVVLGIFFYSAGLGQAADGVFMRRVPFYDKLIERQQRIWMNAPRGLIIGRVKAAGEKTGEFIIESPDGQLWRVKISSGQINDMQMDARVKFVGHEVGERMFEAKITRPVKGNFPLPLPPDPARENEARILKHLMDLETRRRR